MKPRVVLAAMFGALIASFGGSQLRAQEGPAKRLSSIVGVAVEEYGKAIDSHGRLISDIEYEEAVSFLKDAKDVAARLSGARTPAVQAVLDSLTAAVVAKRPPEELIALHERFTAALGTEGGARSPDQGDRPCRGEGDLRAKLRVVSRCDRHWETARRRGG